jgi:hypothetical protein
MVEFVMVLKLVVMEVGTVVVVVTVLFAVRITVDVVV